MYTFVILCIFGAEGDSDIKVTGVLIVPFRGEILWFGTA